MGVVVPLPFPLLPGSVVPLWLPFPFPLLPPGLVLPEELPPECPPEFVPWEGVEGPG